MKNTAQTIKMLEEDIEGMTDSITTMQVAAGNNPFGANVDLGKLADEHMKACESRVNVRIYQNIRLKVLKDILEEIKKG